MRNGPKIARIYVFLVSISLSSRRRMNGMMKQESGREVVSQQFSPTGGFFINPFHVRPIGLYTRRFHNVSF